MQRLGEHDRHLVERREPPSGRELAQDDADALAGDRRFVDQLRRERLRLEPDPRERELQADDVRHLHLVQPAIRRRRRAPAAEVDDE